MTNRPPVNSSAASYPTHPHTVKDRERARRAVELRTHGATYQQIADQIGYYDASAAQRAITRCLDRTESEAAEDYRTLLSERYGDLYRRAINELDAGPAGREVGRAQLLNSARQALDSLMKLHHLDRTPPPGMTPGQTVTVRVRDDIDDELHRLASLLRDSAPEGAPTDVLDAIILETEQLPTADGMTER